MLGKKDGGLDGSPPLFQLPLRPPGRPFPDVHAVALPSRLLCGGQKRSRTGAGQYTVLGDEGLKPLLNVPVTLECPADAKESVHRALERHATSTSATSAAPASAAQGALSVVDERYVVGLFQSDDKRERDTRRRVDYDACRRVLQLNADPKRRLADCTSCLTRGQHQHYKASIDAFIRTLVRPSPTMLYPDMNNVVELVQLEQKEFMKKLRREVKVCAQCDAEGGPCARGGARPPSEVPASTAPGEEEAEDTPKVSHACHNYNYLDEAHVRPFLERRRIRVQREQLLRFLTCAERGGSAAGAVTTSGTSLSTEAETISKESTCVWVLRSQEFASRYAKDDGSAPAVEVDAEVTANTQQLAAHCATVAPGSSPSTKAEQATLPLPLPVALLDGEEVDGCGDFFAPDVVYGEWDGGLDSAHLLHQPMVQSVPTETASAIQAGGLARVVGFSLECHTESLLRLLCAHVQTEQGFRLPVCVHAVPDPTNPSSYVLHICIGQTLLRPTVSRRDLNAEAAGYLIDREPSLPASTRSSRPTAAHSWKPSGQKAATDGVGVVGLTESKSCAALRFTRVPKVRTGDAAPAPSPALLLHTTCNAVFDLQTHQPSFTLTKMEYLNKTSLQEVLSSTGSPLYLLERFSVQEALRMALLFRCHPGATVHVYHVDAYSSTVIAINSLDRAGWEKLVQTTYDVALQEDHCDDDLRCAWNSLDDALRALVHHIVLAAARQLSRTRPVAQALPVGAVAEAEKLYFIVVRPNVPPPEPASSGSNSGNTGTSSTPHTNNAASNARRRWKIMLHLSSVTGLYPGYQPRVAPERERFIEPSGWAVCDNEYRDPATWPLNDRIPFTFPPAKMASPPVVAASPVANPLTVEKG